MYKLCLFGGAWFLGVSWQLLLWKFSVQLAVPDAKN
jgi:hypothetical protein